MIQHYFVLNSQPALHFRYLQEVRAVTDPLTCLFIHLREKLLSWIRGGGVGSCGVLKVKPVSKPIFPARQIIPLQNDASVSEINVNWDE